jgi:hypothetical protein
MTSELAAIPAIGYFFVSLALLVIAWRRRWIHPATTHRLVISFMLFLFGITSLVSALALLGVVTNQETVTFFAAMARTFGIICGIYIANHWWKNE